MGIWICTSSLIAPGNRRSSIAFQMILNVEPLGVWKRKAGAGVGPTDLWKWSKPTQQMFTLEGVPNGKVRGLHEQEVNKLENVYISPSHTAPLCRGRCIATQRLSPLILHSDASLLLICTPASRVLEEQRLSPSDYIEMQF